MQALCQRSISKLALLGLTVVISGGCRHSSLRPETVRVFEDLYQSTIRQRQETQTVELGPLVDLRAVQIPLTMVVSELARQHSTSVVIASELQAELVTAELRQVPLPDALDVIARQLGSEVILLDGVYYVGQALPEDRPILIRRVRRLDREELTAAMEVSRSLDGRVTASNDGLVVMSDKAVVLQRVVGLIESLENAESVGWMVQLYFTRGVKQQIEALGVDVVPAAEIGVGLANVAAVVNPATGAITSGQVPLADYARIDAQISALLQAESERFSGYGVSAPVLLTGDGEEATIFDGRELTAVRRAQNLERGTVTESGVDKFEVGTRVTATVREVADNRGRLSLLVQLKKRAGLTVGLRSADQN